MTGSFLQFITRGVDNIVTINNLQYTPFHTIFRRRSNITFETEILDFPIITKYTFTRLKRLTTKDRMDIIPKFINYFNHPIILSTCCVTILLSACKLYNLIKNNYKSITV